MFVPLISLRWSAGSCSRVPASLRLFRSSPRRHVLFAPLVRAAVAVGARLSRRWWVKLSPERRAVIKNWLYVRRHYWYGAICVLGGGCGVYYWKHVEATPITGRQRFMMLSDKDLVRMVAEEEETLVKEFVGDARMLPASHSYAQLVSAIVRRIVKSNQLESIDWRVLMVDRPGVVNALCLPGGLIIVYTGLIEACQNSHEVALILGHEMAHAVLAHGAESLSHKGLVESVSVVLVALVWALIPNDLLAWFSHSASKNAAHVLLHYPYSRTLETEADHVGLLFASRACFDPTQGAHVWTHLSSLDADVPFLSTHPSNDVRLNNLTALLPTAQSVWEQNNCREAKLFHSTINKLSSEE